MLGLYFRAEITKSTHTVLAKLCWIIPLISIAISVFFSRQNARYYQMNQFNWWYVMFLPMLLLLSAAFTVQREKKVKNRIMSPLPLDIKKLWAARTLHIAGILFLSAAWMYCAQEVISRVFADGAVRFISAQAGLSAVFLCVFLSLWQIPVWMFVFEKLGFAGGMILGLICNMGLALGLNTGTLWFLNPFCYVNRLMCPILGIFPNNLPAEPESPYYFEGALDVSIIPVGIVISVLLFAVCSCATAVWYQRKVEEGWEN